MKLNLFVKGTALAAVSLFLLIPAAFAAGEDTDTNVKPNEYQEKELNINSSILRDQTKYEQSKTTSKIKTDIHFAKPPKARGGSLSPQLFSDLKENPPKTPARMMKEMNISFSDSAVSAPSEDEHEKQTSALLPIIFGFLIALGLVVMIILIPKVNVKAEKK
ncbi:MULTISPECIES: type VII secretion protein EssA [Bacillus]|uniref:type VII secretion protein EssA n=1 Tax=Bacillus TaxID=1386 RepID=UPI00203BEE38|nr:type VII secretion protein EssA [Bacillus safensis]MCM2986703.1 type VII secretion protein EssA [Bacillus safensis]MCY7445822.1 type VII secretion protein EssA [Bacillus safensis]MCY7456321.1 type VII secretion protein EssA [Bacillus safensis]MCY7479665.1 type VII secretion protein EssA [Bacillus safensis]MCY7513771.1 type VII secretion protein EssA [Bacillus safensis]